MTQRIRRKEFREITGVDEVEDEPVRESKSKSVAADDGDSGDDNPVPTKWGGWVKQWASSHNTSYRDAMVNKDCQAGWRDAKPPKDPNAVKAKRVKKVRTCPHCHEEL